MELSTLTDYFRHFLSERPAISPNRLAAELAIDRTNLQKIIKGKRNIPNPRRGDFYQLMQKYGYTTTEFDKEADDFTKQVYPHPTNAEPNNV